MDGHSSGYRRTLAFAAGKLMGIFFRIVPGESHIFQKKSRFLTGRMLLFSAETAERVRNRLPDFPARIERADSVLKYHLHFGIHFFLRLPFQADNRSAAKKYISSCRLIKSGNQLRNSRFSASAFPDNAENFIFTKRKAHIFQSMHDVFAIVKGHRQVLTDKDFLHHASFSMAYASFGTAAMSDFV